MDDDRIKFALVGTGNIAGKYVAAVSNVPNASIELFQGQFRKRSSLRKNTASVIFPIVWSLWHSKLILTRS
jgi:predicted dehydrogenase